MKKLIILITSIWISQFLLSCKSVQSVQQTPETSLSQNFNASYFDTWDAVNKVIDSEPYKVKETDQKTGTILLEPLDTWVYFPDNYVKSQPANLRNIRLWDVRITVRGSDKVSAVQITPKFSGNRYISGTAKVDFQEKQTGNPSANIYEPLESSGALELDLFQKISNEVKQKF